MNTQVTIPCSLNYRVCFNKEDRNRHDPNKVTKRLSIHFYNWNFSEKNYALLSVKVEGYKQTCRHNQVSCFVEKASIKSTAEV